MEDIELKLAGLQELNRDVRLRCHALEQEVSKKSKSEATQNQARHDFKQKSLYFAIAVILSETFFNWTMYLIYYVALDDRRSVNPSNVSSAVSVDDCGQYIILYSKEEILAGRGIYVIFISLFTPALLTFLSPDSYQTPQPPATSHRAATGRLLKASAPLILGWGWKDFVAAVLHVVDDALWHKLIGQLVVAALFTVWVTLMQTMLCDVNLDELERDTIPISVFEQYILRLRALPGT